ncbi:hypothetical protein GCM10018953_17720 [Streptosporangium nondiastaticum]|uniref:very short patch repair endonuclease n=1 Tax=Streptosporangium nondiastaticum TaxID=35764 RepID=UPI0031F7B630
MLPPESTLSSIEGRASMCDNRGKDIRLEPLLRSLLHHRSMRWVDTPPIAKVRLRADLVFPGGRIAVFVDGCYRHSCPGHLRLATTKSAFWRDEIVANWIRNTEINRILVDVM